MRTLKVKKSFERFEVDVYKRQTPACAAGTSRWTRAARRWGFSWRKPVSYTHLDVYKRQPQAAPYAPQAGPQQQQYQQQAMAGMPTPQPQAGASQHPGWGIQ